VFCTDCGAELPDEANFCWKCGKPQREGPGTEEPRWEVCQIFYESAGKTPLFLGIGSVGFGYGLLGRREYTVQESRQYSEQG